MSKAPESLGLRQAIRFAIEPNVYGFCGEKKDQEILRRGLKGQGLPKARKIISGDTYPHLNSFLSAIAKINHQADPFSTDVVASYWIGNQLTETTNSVQARNVLIGEYGKRISLFDQALNQKLPQSFYFTHLSQVALIAAEHYLGQERTDIINQCMIAAGVVISSHPEQQSVTVKREILVNNPDHGYHLDTATQKVKLDPDLTPNLRLGDKIAVHLGYAAAILNPDEAATLSYWTKKVAAQI